MKKIKMINAKKLISLILCAAMLSFAAPLLTFSSAAVDYGIENGAFLFNDSSLLKYIDYSHSLDIGINDSENALSLCVNSSASDPDPYFMFDLSEMDTAYNSEDYKYILITYRTLQSNSAAANTAEVFICSGDMIVPTPKRSVTFSLTNSTSYICEAIDISALSWCTGQLHIIRIDPFCSAAKNDTMYLDSVILCKDEAELEMYKNDRLENTHGAIDPYASGDYVCTSYDVTKYTSPLWKGNIVYNEAVYPIMDQYGNATYTLMYTPDRVISLYSSNFNSYYVEGKDYKVEGNKLTILKTGSIPLVSYSHIHRTTSDYCYRHTAAGDGKYDYWGQLKEFFDGYLNITYTHSDTWTGYTPPNKSSMLPSTAEKISGGENINIVYFGDSICGGANASSYRNVYPYAEYWNEQISSKLKKDYGCNVNTTISSVGGSTASDMVSSINGDVLKYNPDLVFIEFGANDAMNASQDSDYTAAKLKKEFKSAITQMIGKIRASLPNCEIVLVAPFYCNPLCHYMSYFEACRDALSELENEYSGVAVADVTAMHKELLSFKDYLDTSGDNMCHPNDFMSRIFSQVCLETIVPEGVEPYSPKGDIPDESDPSQSASYNTTYACPGGHGWYWPFSEAYGYVGGYGTNTQDIIVKFDLCLLPGGSETSTAKLWTNEASGGGITIAPDHVDISGKAAAYNWGATDISVWHTVIIKIKNGAASVNIDGEDIVSVSSGIIAYTEYQMLFNQTGVMFVDNYSMRSSTGKVYFDCDFENENAANALFSNGLGQYSALGANTVSYDTNGANCTVMNQIKIDDIPLTIADQTPEREGYTFLGWSPDRSDTQPRYRAGDLYGDNKSITLYAVWRPDTSAPEIESITPLSATVTDTGSVTYTMIANGDGLEYSWRCTSDGAELVSVNGDNSLSLTVSVPEAIGKDFVLTFVCTVTNEYGSVESGEVVFNYIHTAPAAKPGDINGDGVINLKDSYDLKKILLGTLILPDKSSSLADVNGDGSVNMKDSYELRKILLATD